MRFTKWIVAALFAGAAMTQAAAQQPVKIRVAWTAPVSNWASILLEKKDLARHLGKSYTLEPVRFAGTPPMITALATGELEVANLAYSTLRSPFKMPASTTCASSPTNFATARPATIRRNTSS